MFFLHKRRKLFLIFISNYGPKKRECLRCGKLFEPISKHNFLCGPCLVAVKGLDF